jgi:hypothetical protein
MFKKTQAHKHKHTIASAQTGAFAARPHPHT